eukprot:10167973-Heterocapsa_arctica.AAC.1
MAIGHTLSAEAIQQNMFDAITHGWHGRSMEKKVQGSMFDMDKNSCHGWVPHGAIYEWLTEHWGDPLTEHKFWNIVLHAKNDKENYNSYMI